jgi:hypothetical protein
MEYLIIGLVLGYLLGTNGLKLPKRREDKPIDKVAEEKKKKFDEHFNGLMSYDAKQAYGGKKL